MTIDYDRKALEFHQALRGKIALLPKKTIKTREDLSIMYTPGVAAPCREIANNSEKVWDYTSRRNWVAVVTDGSAVLGLGNIGPKAALPVMEGKAVLFKEFADIDAFPICLDTQNVDEIVETVLRLAPSFGGINLEDISAPRCFEIEERLIRELDIPVFHDDQHGTAIVVLAGIINALKVTKKSFEKIKIVINGAGAAGIAISKILLSEKVTNIILVDSKGIISKKRNDLSAIKRKMLVSTNPYNIQGGLEEAIKHSDIFIGVSVPNILTKKMIQSMNDFPVIFAMANPIPEIFPDEAKCAGAVIVATGRSDFPNQINNVLAFPGVFRGVLDAHCIKITESMKLAAAHALAEYIKDPNPDNIIPDVFDKNIVHVVANAVKNTLY